MDPHSPYYTKEPFTRLFYQGDEFDPNNKSLAPVYAFKSFRDYFLTWFPEGCTDAEYIIAQYDASVAYMDMCIAQLLEKLREKQMIIAGNGVCGNIACVKVAVCGIIRYGKQNGGAVRNARALQQIGLLYGTVGKREGSGKSDPVCEK
jgi:hypothetical protein